jgi:hypothetical protein
MIGQIYRAMFTSQQGSARRQARRNARIAERARRFDARQSGRGERASNRQETFQQLGDLASSIFGQRGNTPQYQGQETNGSSSAVQQINPLYLIGAGLLVFMLIKKR